jgi:predicted DCC family thiol-disulfide oxidoreductase YuxK
MPDLTVLYDGSCSLCRASVARVRPFDRRRCIEFLDLHDPSVQQRFPQVDREIALRWMQAVDAQGRVWSGSEAWARIGFLLPGWNLVAWILLVPGVRWLAAKIYAWIARNRYRWNRELCSDGTCSLHIPGNPDSASQPRRGVIR